VTLVGEVAGTRAEVHNRAVSAAVSGDDVLADAVARINAAGIAVSELSLHLPSLDEVFFTLTGRKEVAA
jgi:oleandomycin transport system ATP-binding protein